MIEKIIKTRELTNKMSKEDLDNGYEHFLTVGENLVLELGRRGIKR